jgi:DNA-binding MarR family transcriptional regulator
MKSTYLRFLALVQAIDGLHPKSTNIDETAKQLLNAIALRHAQGKSLTVTDAMALSSIASPATIHRKLDGLREVGLIEQTFEGKNRRTKYLMPTTLADNYFSSVGNLMQQAHASD